MGGRFRFRVKVCLVLENFLTRADQGLRKLSLSGKKGVREVGEEGCQGQKRVVLVIINEQHTLLPDQIRALDEEFGAGGWETYKIPSEGLTKKQQYKVALKIFIRDVVFVSPIPLLLRECASRRHFETYVMHNDKREKKELPGGKIITIVAQDGWEIL